MHLHSLVVFLVLTTALTAGMQPPYGMQSFNIGSYTERYWIDGPPLQEGQRYPLVIMFHGVGESADPNSWDFGAQAFVNQATSWSGPSPYIVVFHNGGTSAAPSVGINTYGSEEFMRATEAVLENVCHQWPIDTNRIYGYGFSMGGGECLAFAARHQDPTSNQMFAAAVSQSGALSLTRSWSYLVSLGQGGLNGLQTMQTMFNSTAFGLTDAADFPYQRATVLDLATASMPLSSYTTKLGYQQANNLRWVPTMATFVPDDVANRSNGIAEPSKQFIAFQQEQGNPAAPGYEPPFRYVADTHNWWDIDPRRILDFFDQHTKQSTCAKFSTQLDDVPQPDTPETLLFANDNTRQHSFSVVRSNPNEWARLRVTVWDSALPTPANSISLTPRSTTAPQNSNIAELTIHCDNYLSGLDWTYTANMVIEALNEDLGSIICEGASLPGDAFFFNETSQNWDDADLNVDYTYANNTLTLLVDSNGLQRRWRLEQ